MIVLLSGWAGFRASLIPMQLALRERSGREVTRADVGLGLGCIHESAERLAIELELVTRGADGPLDLVGYSMGGLIATQLLKVVDRGARVRTVVTLDTPHRGSPALRTRGALFARWSASLRQIVPGCEFLESLAAAAVPPGSRVVSISSYGDTLVPPPFAELPPLEGHSNRVLSGIGHFGLLVSPAALGAIEPLVTPPVTRRARKSPRAPRSPSARARAAGAL